MLILNKPKYMKQLKDNIYCENCNIAVTYIVMPVAYSEPHQRSKMEYFAKIFNTKKLLTTVTKCTILDV